VTVCVEPGIITIEPVCTLDFGNIPVSTENQYLTEQLACYITVTDLLGDDAGYTVTIQAGDLALQSGSYVIDSNNMSISNSGGQAVHLSGDVNPLVMSNQLANDPFGNGNIYTIIYRNPANNN